MDGDDYGDDFEDYEDVEEDSQTVELQAKQQVSALSGMQKKASLIGEPLRDLKAIQSALNRENTSLERRVARFAGEKYTHEDLIELEEKGRTEEARKQPKYGFTTLRPLGSRALLNPAIQHASVTRSKLALVQEQHVVFDQPSLTAHQMYLLELRSTRPHARERSAA